MPDEAYGLGFKKQLGNDAWTVPDMLRARAEQSPDSPALWSLCGAQGEWCSISWGEYRHEMAVVAAGLGQLKLSAGDRVGIMAPSCQRWDLLQMGILAAGGVVVGLDPNDLDDNLDSVARRCGLAGLIVFDPGWLKRFSTEVRGDLRFVVHLGSGEGVEKGIAYDDLLQLGDPKALDNCYTAKPEDPATIIFTSGTTGAPKGIQYSHRQVCLAVASILEAFPDIDVGSRLVSWLPLSNMFQRIINALAIACGAQTYYVEDPREIMRHVGKIGPHLFIGVPRFYEKLYAGILDQVRQGPAWQRGLVAWAMHMGDSKARALRGGRRPHALQQIYHDIADRLVLRRLRAVMGPNLRYMVSGSAPMSLWLLQRFHAMGLLVLEAYGMSENIIPVATNRLNAYRFGTVGHAMRGSDVRLAEDGELMVRGPGVARSYYGEAASLLDADGYLASGDFAAIDTEGFITLTGRKSEIFKTATGRRIAPVGIEGHLLALPAIEHAVVFGASRPFLVAVVVVGEKALDMEGHAGDGRVGLLAYSRQLRRLIAEAVEPLPSYKRPAGMVVTAQPFTVDSGELTANLKLRRRTIAAHYADQIETLYRLLDRAKGEPVEELLDSQEPDMVICSL